MKYKNIDINQYVKAKEYIDTALIPLIPYSFSNDQELEDLALQGEYIYLFANQIEKELKGRVFLTPEYYYLKTDKITETESFRLEHLINHMKSQPFKYIFLLTFDNKWRKVTKDMDAELIWIPAMKGGDLNQSETQQLVQSQIEEIQSLIKDSWSE
ncbi:DUF2487 family protein [Aquisalibacillus elongatus]|uniref:Uncharacterized protein DUF2487 n=1 Tax=Aquisalibacillus elongatus TaxID=485577 RepID=A0A3N5CAR9_9BACI|nr:DUF2487 family protein [Aquisalibacillus elongatus]RPF55775.1 uncharacterized protein DUF2487 [Aquisalibacillus elongatus]